MKYKNILNAMTISALVAVTIGFTSCSNDDGLTKEDISSAIDESVIGDNEGNRVDDPALVGTWKATLESEKTELEEDADGNKVYRTRVKTIEMTFNSDKSFKKTEITTTTTGKEDPIVDKEVEESTYYTTSRGGGKYFATVISEKDVDLVSTELAKYEMVNGKLKIEYQEGYGNTYVMLTKQ